MTSLLSHYTPERALDEDLAWCLNRTFDRFSGFVTPRLAGIQTLLELGCKSGLLAQQLPQEIDYLGIEQHAWWFLKAIARNPGKKFLSGTAPYLKTYDACLSFQTLKHVPLEGWDKAVAEICFYGRQTGFNMQLASHDLDNGTTFPHVFVTEARLRNAVKQAGQEVVAFEVPDEWKLEGEGMAKEVLVWTKKS